MARALSLEHYKMCVFHKYNLNTALYCSDRLSPRAILQARQNEKKDKCFPKDNLKRDRK
jgi:hypothetical protein